MFIAHYIYNIPNIGWLFGLMAYFVSFNAESKLKKKKKKEQKVKILTNFKFLKDRL